MHWSCTISRALQKNSARSSRPFFVACALVLTMHVHIITCCPGNCAGAFNFRCHSPSLFSLGNKLSAFQFSFPIDYEIVPDLWRKLTQLVLVVNSSERKSTLTHRVVHGNRYRLVDGLKRKSPLTPTKKPPRFGVVFFLPLSGVGDWFANASNGV